MEKVKQIKSVLIKNGQVVTETGIVNHDVFCNNGIIEFIGDSKKIKDKISSLTEIIDAENMFVIPGGIDPHVHFDLPIGNGLRSSDSFKSGTRAAIYGGTTTIIDFVTPKRGSSLIKSYRERIKEAEKSLCNFRLHMSITEWTDKTESEMKECVLKEKINSFKVYMAYKDTIGLNIDEIFKVMKIASGLDSLVMVHCEEGDRIEKLKQSFIKNKNKDIKYHPISRPPETEGDAVKKIIKLSNQTNCKTYIVHNSTKNGLDAVRNNKKKDLVFVETCPHYLTLDDTVYNSSDFDEVSKFIMSPPLRSKEHMKALWKGIKEGLIDVIATDHCPFNKKDRLKYKDQGFSKIPNGVGSIENRLSILFTFGVLTGKICVNRFVELISTNPAKIFGFYPQKGVIAEGADSDIVIWDPNIERTISAKTHRQNCDTNIFEGFKLKGNTFKIIISDKMYIV